MGNTTALLQRQLSNLDYLAILGHRYQLCSSAFFQANAILV